MSNIDVAATVRRGDRRGKGIEVRLLVDTGAVYSVLPHEVWQALELQPMDRADFTLADGSVITRDVSECRFEIQGKAATSPVVLGEAAEGPAAARTTTNAVSA